MSMSIRLGLFYSSWGNLRHGSSIDYGSAAIGLSNGDGLTINAAEKARIAKVADNHSGNYLIFYDSENRKDFTEFLPGPAIVLRAFWIVLPYNNFAPYIIFQIILDSLLISLVYAVFERSDKAMLLVIAVLMALNLPVIRRTLMMGYDFWPQFAVLISFIGLYYAIEKNKSGIFLLVGILAGITVWFRSITSFLPFVLVIFIVIYQKLKDRKGYLKVTKNALLYILPVIILIASLSLFRYQQTGNLRPTRSTFWHSFFSGIAQFSNPYDIRSSDDEVWRLGQKLNPELQGLSLSEMYKTPDSPYEETLRKEAARFLRENPYLFIRNIFYRMAIMVSPFLYRSGDFIPPSMHKALIPIGIIAALLWIFGMAHIFRNHHLIFWLSTSIYIYFALSFSWFYIVGRVILPFMFINIFVYVFGLKSLFKKVMRIRPVKQSA
jgi:hypothetical protein